MNNSIYSSSTRTNDPDAEETCSEFTNPATNADSTIVEYGLFSDLTPSIVLDILEEEIDFDNDDPTKGTIDVYMSNVPACSYCQNWSYNNNEFRWYNSILPNGDVLISFRVLNILIIVDKETRKIKWERQDIAFGHQHDSHILDNGNILVFCNGFHGRDVGKVTFG